MRRGCKRGVAVAGPVDPLPLVTPKPQRWWLYAGLATIPIATLVLVLTPIWVDPLFTTSAP